MRFSGREFARKRKRELKERLRRTDKGLKLVSFLVGENKESKLYVGKKQEAARDLGVEFEVVREEGVVLEDLVERVKKEGRRENVDGLMVQLPLPKKVRVDTEKVLAVIPKEKDVDGLRWEESGVMPAAVRAVFSILKEIAVEQGLGEQFVVVGAEGRVGKPLTYFLKEMNKEVLEVEIDTKNPGEIMRKGEVVVSCVGKPGLIRKEQIREDAVVVDVGISRFEGEVAGDMGEDVYGKARVAVSVPGGVGPVTVVSLFENLVEISN